ncbi:[NiFe]-hydrogenase assembly chaperone HybE [Methylobacter sp. BBA5.1]|uniref:[NiFe]-hydrogenase assembly chaperone HybE n=1 Tax=Methylobacter sp. BBA5.1 TaxID=1495064 RepID=UPI0005641A28|nr:[NiFe]-hydrogenase assembly chaperone HybE [Methylobacter sp. BBA5.1]
MQWRNVEQISCALETVFNGVLETRMRGVPIINPALSVQAIGFNPFNGDWPGVLITPWFMNLLLLPGPDSQWREQPPGGKFQQSFPYGTFEFTLAREAQLGTYALCSLFSPMFQFENQSAALAAAQAALQGLLTVPAARAVSRRDLLRGAFGSR